MMRRSLSLVLLAAALALPVGASTFIHQTQPQLLRASAAVIEGQVISTSSFWNETGQVIVTEALIQVHETLVGEAPSVVVVRTFGGGVGGFVVEAHGFPTFRAGERLLLFLEPEKDGKTRVAGYQQGQFRIERDPSGLEVAIPAVSEGANFVGGKAQVQPLALSTLRQSILRDARAVGHLQN
jgi:hypothetical protein